MPSWAWLPACPAPTLATSSAESIELAFTAALQHLPARQRAVLIMREVPGFSARETAEVLDTTPVSVDSALQRARKTIDRRAPAQSRQQTLRALGDAAMREVVARFAEAREHRDVQALVAMLAEDARRQDAGVAACLITPPPGVSATEG